MPTPNAMCFFAFGRDRSSGLGIVEHRRVAVGRPHIRIARSPAQSG